MLKCWEENAENRPTFIEIVSKYHSGLMPGTAKAEEGDDYVLLGSEENSSTVENQQREEKSLSNTSVMNVTIVDNRRENVPSVGGTTFHVTLLHDPNGSEEPIIAAQPDNEYYVEMNAMSNVLVNQAARECDGIPDEGSHVTSSADHVISDMDHVTPTEQELDYVVMQEAEPAKPIN